MLYKRIRNALIKKIQTDSISGILAKLFFRVFASIFAKSLINILGTVIIATLIGCHYFGFWFILVCVIYCICTFLAALAEKYKQEKLIDVRMQQQALYGLNVTLRSWAIKLAKYTKRNLINKSEKTPIRDTVGDIDFQTAAFTVCKKIKDSLTKYYDIEDIYVTVFQRDGERCRMIAHSEVQDPSSFRDIYSFENFVQDQTREIEFHSYLFYTNSTEIAALACHEEVDSHFKYHSISKEREEKIEQYICIPIAPGDEVAFLLQIDTSIPCLFGEASDELKRFAKTVLYPFAQFLRMVYEQGRVIEGIIRREENEK